MCTQRDGNNQIQMNKQQSVFSTPNFGYSLYGLCRSLTRPKATRALQLTTTCWHCIWVLRHLSEHWMLLTSAVTLIFSSCATFFVWCNSASLADAVLLLRLRYDRLLACCHGVSGAVPILHPYAFWYGQDKRCQDLSFIIGAEKRQRLLSTTHVGCAGSDFADVMKIEQGINVNAAHLPTEASLPVYTLPEHLCTFPVLAAV